MKHLLKITQCFVILCLYSTLTINSIFALSHLSTLSGRNLVKTSSAVFTLMEETPSPKIGQLPSITGLYLIKKSIYDGIPIDFVNTGTGELSFGVNDLSFAGNLLQFARTYSSKNIDNVGLGRGWSYIFSDKIFINDDEGVYYNNLGERLSLVREGGNGHFKLYNPESASIQIFEVVDSVTIKSEDAFSTREFKKLGEYYFLTSIQLSSGEYVTITRKPNGLPTKFSNDTNTVFLNWNEEINPILLSINDNLGRNINFNYEDNNLTNVSLATNSYWQYSYTNKRLVQIANDLNPSLLQIQYNFAGKVSSIGNSDTKNFFTYRGVADLRSAYTKITNLSGYFLEINHSFKGLISSINDNGVIYNFSYNSNNQLLKVENEQEQVILALKYDSRGNIVEQQNPDGTFVNFVYNQEGKLLKFTEDTGQVSQPENNCFNSYECVTGIVACGLGIKTVVGGFITLSTCPTVVGCVIAVGAITLGGASIGLNCGKAVRVCNWVRVCPNQN